MIFPKKQPLYSPMLGTFGGASVKGFQASSGGGVPDSFQSTETLKDTADGMYFGFSRDDIVNHFSHGEITTANLDLKVPYNLGQVFNLAGKHIYPIILGMGGTAGDQCNTWKNCVAMICLLEITSSGATLGKTHRILGTDVHSDLSNTNPNHDDVNIANRWGVNKYNYYLNPWVYPVNWGNSGNKNGDKFGVVITGQNNSYDYLYHEVFQINSSTLEITSHSTNHHRKNSGDDFNVDSPFTSTTHYTNTEIARQLIKAQGCQMLPHPSNDYVAYNFGSVRNFHETGKSWGMRFGSMRTNTNVGVLNTFKTGSFSTDGDPTVFGGAWDGTGDYVTWTRWNWSNRDPLYWYRDQVVGVTGDSGNFANSGTLATASDIGNQPGFGAYDPNTGYMYHLLRNGTGTVKKIKTQGANYNSPSVASFVYTENNQLSGILVYGEYGLMMDNNGSLGRFAHNQSSAQAVTSTNFSANGCIVLNASNDMFIIYGICNNPANGSNFSSFKLGRNMINTTSFRDYPAILGQYK